MATTSTDERARSSAPSPTTGHGRIIGLREQDLQEYLDRSRIQPGDLRHLYASDAA